MSHLPRRVSVKKVLSSRYPVGSRPVSWDERSAGNEKISTSSGEEILLSSGGGQSSPAPGWELLLTEKKVDGALAWTLYGLPREKNN